MPVISRRRWQAPLALCLGVLAVLVVSAGLADALAQSPFGVRTPAPPPASAETGLVGWVLAQQAQFYRSLSGLIRAAKADGTAMWTLFGVSFVYGILHAAGPGHGKAVISSYLIANEETWRRGIVLSFASALLQALVAIAVVAVAAVALNATAATMTEAVRWIETASYALIVVIGVRLVLTKGRGFLRAVREQRAEAGADGGALVLAPALSGVPAGTGFLHAEPHRDGLARSHVHGSAIHAEPAAAEPHDHAHHDHAHHGHDHHHGSACACGHAHHNDHDHAHDHHHHDHDGCCSHGPAPAELAGPGGWSRGLAAIVAVGLRPCSGAILVLVFALSQGLFWAGVGSTLLMGLGTALTVSGIATLAVGAKGVASRLAGAKDGRGALMVRGLEVAAACAVVLFGLALLGGYMASERMI
ncbi:putative membrane protein [Rhodovulum sp. PH10]|uniref:nickel/cobalt transporter n=1 Tax=Rhodovulum sp. PH10 TaxID=1187851 RepID=UPI00027C2D5D|nr:nickel transporter [Rhodovulum sp. PH10]EJW09960.1 putative membrane protein [Rhodovulum sp. PH10]